MTNQKKIQELIQEKEYKEPKELRQILTYYKLTNKLNNIYFDLENNSPYSVKLVSDNSDNLDQIIAGKKEILNIENKNKIAFYVIRLLNLYKPLNHVLIVYTKKNLATWKINLDSLLTGKAKETYQKKPQYQLLQEVKNKDIETLWQGEKNNLKTICLLSEGSLSNLAKSLEEKQEYLFKDYDLVIFENFKQTGKNQENKDKIVAKYNAILSFSDFEIPLNKYPALKEIKTEESANYSLLVKQNFTKEKIYFGNSNHDSQEIIKFIEDFITIHKKGICKLNKESGNQYKFQRSKENKEAQNLPQEILKHDKKNSNFYNFNINSLDNIVIFNPNFIPQTNLYSLIDAGHPVIKWIQSQIKINDIFPLSACKIPLQYLQKLGDLSSKNNLIKGTYFYLIALKNSPESKIISHVINLDDNNVFWEEKESEKFIYYAFYSDKTEQFPNAGNNADLQKINQAYDKLNTQIKKQPQDGNMEKVENNSTNLDYIAAGLIIIE